jgi:hypothetical protein
VKKKGEKGRIIKNKHKKEEKAIKNLKHKKGKNRVSKEKKINIKGNKIEGTKDKSSDT